MPNFVLRTTPTRQFIEKGSDACCEQVHADSWLHAKELFGFALTKLQSEIRAHQLAGIKWSP